MYKYSLEYQIQTDKNKKRQNTDINIPTYSTLVTVELSFLFIKKSTQTTEILSKNNRTIDTLITHLRRDSKGAVRQESVDINVCNVVIST